MKSFAFYWLPNCSTCKKAAEFLRRENIEVAAFRDLKADPLARREVGDLAAKAGGANELFSRRAVKYREMKLNERELSEEEMLDLMAAEYTFIKRPVLVSGEGAIAGFSEKRYKEFL